VPITFSVTPWHWEPARGVPRPVEDPTECPNFWPTPISRGKNFGGVFLDVFSHPEFKSAVRLSKYSFLPKILELLSLFVRDCTLSYQNSPDIIEQDLVREFSHFFASDFKVC
jgi:hypothetical protein